VSGLLGLIFPVSLKRADRLGGSVRLLMNPLIVGETGVDVGSRRSKDVDQMLPVNGLHDSCHVEVVSFQGSLGLRPLD